MCVDVLVDDSEHRLHATKHLADNKLLQLLYLPVDGTGPGPVLWSVKEKEMKDKRMAKEFNSWPCRRAAVLSLSFRLASLLIYLLIYFIIIIYVRVFVGAERINDFGQSNGERGQAAAAAAAAAADGTRRGALSRWRSRDDKPRRGGGNDDERDRGRAPAARECSRAHVGSGSGSRSGSLRRRAE